MIDFEMQYVFCKNNRLVLIVECLFAKASPANAVAWRKLFTGSTSSFAFI